MASVFPIQNKELFSKVVFPQKQNTIKHNQSFSCTFFTSLWIKTDVYVLQRLVAFVARVSTTLFIRRQNTAQATHWGKLLIHFSENSKCQNSRKLTSNGQKLTKIVKIECFQKSFFRKIVSIGCHSVGNGGSSEESQSEDLTSLEFKQSWLCI